ncbi:hypothetical protein SNOG_12811 [Parastagonospora nodorum SN15]|uniref:Extracellular membrane protein CFEM domain-containing protein n=1 Tax=Phaeosphaeria nodorum (strain SN15 / ATCC MYA-4574 / FGSC 10173) TaxID=321614 RepID=Q0U603_PHANO|nr:hypothetical protein SNOG_12811 [Parastagonospora nodorum SN15]EAT79611.1 hypothetical protein SNOG_12811 [Parastagonospora nodorum SN15]
MRIVLLVGALAALATAFPRPQDDTPDDTPDEPSDDPATISLGFPTATIPVTLITSLNIPVTESFEIVKPTKSKRPHWEPIPIFTKQCKCDVATVRYPCWATDALQKCNYEENFSYGCYMEAAGGCPTPTRARSLQTNTHDRPSSLRFWRKSASIADTVSEHHYTGTYIDDIDMECVAADWEYHGTCGADCKRHAACAADWKCHFADYTSCVRLQYMYSLPVYR